MCLPISRRGTMPHPWSSTMHPRRSSHSVFLDVTVKTTEHQKKWRQKKSHGAPVFVGSEKAQRVGTQYSQIKHGRPLSRGGNSKSGGRRSLSSQKGVHVTAGSQRRGKLRVPDYLRQHLLKVASKLGAPVPARSPQVAPVPTVSPQDTHSLQREAVPAPKVPKPKIPEQMRQDLLQQKPQASSVHEEPVPNKTPERQRLKTLKLFQLFARASSEKGTLVLNKTPEKKRLKTEQRPEPLQGAAAVVSSNLLREGSSRSHGSKDPERQNPELLKQDLLQQKPQASPAQVPTGKPQQQEYGGLLSITACLPLPPRHYPGPQTLCLCILVPYKEHRLPTTGSKSQNDGAVEEDAEGTESIKAFYKPTIACLYPHKKLGVVMDKVPLKPKLGRQKHQAPQPRSQLTLKMDHAGVGQRSPPEKKERMANKIKAAVGTRRLKAIMQHIYMFNGIFVNI
ncbi:L-2-aminoadipate reductase [Labeo rohita]|uniref:L-2-aminoadipate reductase n=1 Tax=Labeo rohita TaxID=84645 RepID=A0ABQ8L4E3_LABRO|nr:L-2-aminoadipate reductase [Labeo rohita]